MADYFDELIGVTGNPYASKVSDGMLGSVNEHIDTGSYILNGLLSGSIYKGLPSNKITAFAGESATGKTFFLLGLVKQFLADNTDGGVLYFESETFRRLFVLFFWGPHLLVHYCLCRHRRNDY